MKKNLLASLFLSGVTVAFLGGCTGNEVMPNNATQGAAATGAVAGAVIGYNTGSRRHRARNAAIGALVGTTIGAGVGNAYDQSNTPPPQTGGWE